MSLTVCEAGLFLSNRKGNNSQAYGNTRLSQLHALGEVDCSHTRDTILALKLCSKGHMYIYICTTCGNSKDSRRVSHQIWSLNLGSFVIWGEKRLSEPCWDVKTQQHSCLPTLLRCKKKKRKKKKSKKKVQNSLCLCLSVCLSLL